MKMTEAQFRFHQILHYFSTYGMGRAAYRQKRSAGAGFRRRKGLSVQKRTKRLLEDTVLELVYEDEAGKVCLQRLFFQGAERLTEPQLELVRLSLCDGRGGRSC